MRKNRGSFRHLDRFLFPNAYHQSFEKKKRDGTMHDRKHVRNEGERSFVLTDLQEEGRKTKKKRTLSSDSTHPNDVRVRTERRKRKRGSNETRFGIPIPNPILLLLLLLRLRERVTSRSTIDSAIRNTLSLILRWKSGMKERQRIDRFPSTSEAFLFIPYGVPSYVG